MTDCLRDSYQPQPAPKRRGRPPKNSQVKPEVIDKPAPKQRAARRKRQYTTPEYVEDSDQYEYVYEWYTADVF